MKKLLVTLSLVLVGLVSIGSSFAQPDHQILFQGFNWESWRKQGGWYNCLIGQVDDIASTGVTHVWLPPPSHSVSPQGPCSYRISKELEEDLNCQAAYHTTWSYPRFRV